MTELETPAQERGTYVVQTTFYNENGAVVTPSSITWSLTDELGNVVNSRSGVTVSAASTINIVLSGADLAITSDYTGKWRRLLIEAVYNSSLGTDLPLKEEIRFRIEDYIKVT